MVLGTTERRLDSGVRKGSSRHLAPEVPSAAVTHSTGGFGPAGVTDLQGKTKEEVVHPFRPLSLFRVG